MNQISLYIHIPFCGSKCLFCSFVISVGQDHRRDNYAKALVEEMKKYRDLEIKTIYFGGGTPSLMDEDHLEIIMNALRNNFLLQNDLEMTIEVNPESVDRAKIKFLKEIGFNRISLGVQSLNNNYLKFLGRKHDASRAVGSYEILREEGFTNINLDLMYAFPGETKKELEDDVRKIAQLGSEHLSLYSLTIEPNSRFYATQMKLDDDEKLAGDYLTIGQMLTEDGFKQYEISNFSRSPEHESAHNKNYWRGAPYIGLGVGAHGFDGRRRSWNTSNLQEYIQKASGGEETVEGFEDLTDSQLVMEKILFGLRMNEGIFMESVPKTKQGLIRTWIKDGFFYIENDRLKTTDRGRLILDELSARLI